jgi:hypothetical protein
VKIPPAQRLRFCHTHTADEIFKRVLFSAEKKTRIEGKNGRTMCRTCQALLCFILISRRIKMSLKGKYFAFSLHGNAFLFAKQHMWIYA